MKSPVSLLFAFCLVMAGSGANAAPPKRADLPAHPAWVLHIDCDALRQTFLGKYLLYQMSKPEYYSNMVAFRSVFSFDLRTQLHGLTFYSDGPSTRDNVIITYADFDPAQLISLVKGCDSAEVATNHHHVIYSWLDKKNTPNDAEAPRNFAAIQNGVMVSGRDVGRVSAALDVMDGTAPNLSTSKALPELAAAGDNTFVQGVAHKLDFLGSDPTSNLIKLSKRVKLRASETEEQLNAVLTLEAGDEATAQKISLASQGLIALLSLQKDNPGAAKLAENLSIKLDGSTVTATLNMPSADLIAVFKAYTAKTDKPLAETK